MTRTEKVLGYFAEKSYTPQTLDELVVTLDVKKENVAELSGILDELTQKGEIVKTKKKRYALTKKMNMVSGKLSGNQKGFGFVVPQEKKNGEQDLFIAAENMAGALHGDLVVAKVLPKTKNGKTEGEIVTILERANKTLIGTFEKNGKFGFVVPDNKNISSDVFIPTDCVHKAKNGEKVVVTVTKWGDGRRNPTGSITEILGFAGNMDTDMNAILRAHSFDSEFPPRVLEEADKILQTVPEDEIAKRRDFRDMRVFTIDGADAKDLDDAVAIEKIQDGYRLYVHIADVGHYVKRGSFLDKEAFKRGTSVYLVDRVVPMLPKSLSNGICSLNPGENRLVLSCIMDIDITGKVTSYEIVEGVIKTVFRMNYQDVADIIEKQPAGLMEKYSAITDDIFMMRDLAKILNDKRQARGSINFNVPEAKVLLDEAGKVTDIVKRETRVSDNIIEEFMLVANETVAEHAFWADLPFVYRVHESPNEEKIRALSAFIYNMGYKLKNVEDIRPKDIAHLIDEIAGKPEEVVISTLALRCMMKACYAPQNQGHYGLAAKYYCHFTSPIRRYPDLTIHRILKDQMHRTLDAKSYGRFTPLAANQSSEREKEAELAERDTQDLKKAEFMAGKIGEEFPGVISTVKSFGIFVQLDNLVEGLVRVETMADDYYVYNEENYCLTGERTGRRMTIGDVVKIRVAGANVALRQIDFELVEGPPGPKKAKPLKAAAKPVKAAKAAQKGGAKPGKKGRPAPKAKAKNKKMKSKK